MIEWKIKDHSVLGRPFKRFNVVCYGVSKQRNFTEARIYIDMIEAPFVYILKANVFLVEVKQVYSFKSDRVASEDH